jgi:hypothetical protein
LCCDGKPAQAVFFIRFWGYPRTVLDQCIFFVELAVFPYLGETRAHALGKKRQPGPVISPNPGLGGLGIRTILTCPFHFHHLSPLPVVLASRRTLPRQLSPMSSSFFCTLTTDLAGASVLFASSSRFWSPSCSTPSPQD